MGKRKTGRRNWVFLPKYKICREKRNRVWKASLGKNVSNDKIMDDSFFLSEDDGLITPTVGLWSKSKYRIVYEYNELFNYFLVLGIIAIMLEIILNNTWLRKIP